MLGAISKGTRPLQRGSAQWGLALLLALAVSPWVSAQTPFEWAGQEQDALIFGGLSCAGCAPIHSCGTTCYEANGDMSSCGQAGPTCASARVNVARNATASASSTYGASYPARGTINGNRKTWFNSNAWNDNTAGVFPDWLLISWGSSYKTISEIDVFSLQDNYSAPSDPTTAMTFSVYGLTDFQVQYWDGSRFVTVPNGNVTGNNKVWRRFELSPPIVTNQVRIWVTNALNGYSRIVEVEAWEDRSALSADYATAIDTRITMSGLMGCDATATQRYISGVAGYYKHCDYNWIVWSPSNGAWILPQSHISNLYLGGTVWPAFTTSTMDKMGFPNGAYHGSDATDNYQVFERGILAKSHSHAAVRRIGGLDQYSGSNWQTMNDAIAKSWLESRLPDKYPTSDTTPYGSNAVSCGPAVSSNRGFLFSTEPNAGGYNSTFMIKDGGEKAFRLEGAIEDKWWSAPCGDKAKLGWPIANERAFNQAGHTISQFEGGAILWQPISACNGAFEAKLVTGSTYGTVPRFVGALSGIACPSSPTVIGCIDGDVTPFGAPNVTEGTYQFGCTSSTGWPDLLILQWRTHNGGFVYREVPEPILTKYLNSDVVNAGGIQFKVQDAISFTPGDTTTGMGLPLTMPYVEGIETRQAFQNGVIRDLKQCSEVCTTTSPCATQCGDGATRIACGNYKPWPYTFGKCQLYDVYCEMPEVTDGRVVDDNEEGAGGPKAFFFYLNPNNGHQGHEKGGRMPVQLGGVGGATTSNYLEDWQAHRPGIVQSEFPYANNLVGTKSTFTNGRLELEIGDTDSYGPQGVGVRKHPVVSARQCVAVKQPSYGAHPAPSFPATSNHDVREDDECIVTTWSGPPYFSVPLFVEKSSSCEGVSLLHQQTCVCNPDDGVGSIRLTHGFCYSQVWSGGADFGWTSPYTISGISGVSGGDIAWLTVRDYCYRGLNRWFSAAEGLQTDAFGIGSATYPGYEAPW